MNSKRAELLASIAIVSVIISYGVLGPYVWPFYQSIVESVLPTTLLERLPFYASRFSEKPSDHYKMGIYYLYYPSYICLHLGLIAVVFRRSLRTRMLGFNIILIGFSLLIGIIIISHELQWTLLFNISHEIFSGMVRMPFILFVVEGGRLLDLQIDRLIRKKEGLSVK